MPKGFEDNEYIPRPNQAFAKAPSQTWGDAAKQWFTEERAARERLEQTQRMLEPLKTAWTDEDRAWLCALRIKVS